MDEVNSHKFENGFHHKEKGEIIGQIGCNFNLQVFKVERGHLSPAEQGTGECRVREVYANVLPVKVGCPCQSDADCGDVAQKRVEREHGHEVVEGLADSGDELGAEL